MRNTPIRVLIADDHVVVREGLRALLAEEPGIVVVGEAANGAEAVALAGSLHPDVVLMDLVMPEMGGIEAIRHIRKNANPSCRVLVLTSFADGRTIREAIQAGATGYLLKDVLKPDLLRAVCAAAQGQPTLHPEAQRHLMQQVAAPSSPSPFEDLTDRERDVLRLIARGCSN